MKDEYIKISTTSNTLLLTPKPIGLGKGSQVNTHFSGLSIMDHYIKFWNPKLYRKLLIQNAIRIRLKSMTADEDEDL